MHVGCIKPFIMQSMVTMCIHGSKLIHHAVPILTCRMEIRSESVIVRY